MQLWLAERLAQAGYLGSSLGMQSLSYMVVLSGNLGGCGRDLEMGLEGLIVLSSRHARV